MPAFLSQLLSDLAGTGVLSAAEHETLAADSSDINPQDLLKRMVGSGRLTEYQSQLLLSGRGNELRLGNYLILDKLGEGGMGTVYKAVHLLLHRTVAVKTIRPSIAGQYAIQRFQQEIEALGRLNHINVVRATDASEDRGTWFLVMDLVAGVDVSELSHRLGPLPSQQACEIVRQVAAGLEYIHESGLVHRDIKPSNLMLSEEGVIRILDLGLARLQRGGSPDRRLTAEGQILGTVDYMAPEQAAGEKEIDIRADLYSLGCLLYRLLAGHVPYGPPRYAGKMERLLAHIQDPFPDLRELRPDLPKGCLDIISRLVAKNPAARYSTPADLVRAIEPYCVGANLRELMDTNLTTSHAPPSRAGIAVTQLREPLASSAAKRSTRYRRRCLAATIIVAVVLLAIAIPQISEWIRPTIAPPGAQSDRTADDKAAGLRDLELVQEDESDASSAVENAEVVEHGRTSAEQSRFVSVSRIASRISQPLSADPAGYDEFFKALAEVQNQQDRVTLLQQLASALDSTSDGGDLAQDLLNFIDGLSKDQKAEMARPLLDACVQFASDSSAPRMKRAQLASARGDTTAAIADYDEILKRDPVNVAALNQRGILRSSKGEYESSIADLSEAIHLDPDAGNYHARGDAWRLSREWDRAIADYDETLRRDPTHVLALMHRGMAWGAKGDHDRAIADFSETLRLDPKSAYGFNNRGVEWQSKREFDKAIADYSEAIRLEPAFALAYANRGRVWNAMNEHGKALADLDESIRIAPSGDVFSTRAIMWLNKNDFEQAIADFDQALALGKGDLVATLVNLGQALNAKGDLDQAIADVSFAITKNPKSSIAFNNRGHFWLDKKEYDRAISDFDAALQIDPKSARSLFGRARARFGKAEYQAAANDFEATLQMASLPVMQMRFAEFLATCPDESFRDGPRAVELAWAAIDSLQASATASYYDTLATAYAEIGDFDDALAAHEESARRRLTTGPPDEICRLEGHTDKVTSLAISPDGRQLISGSDDGTMRLWDLESGEQRRVFQGHASFVLSVAFSSDGKQALTGSGGEFRNNQFREGNDRALRLWDLKSGAQLFESPSHGAPIWSVGFLDTDQRAFSLTDSSESVLRIWDLQSQTELRRVGALQHSGQGVALSPERKRIITAGNPPDWSGRIWDLESGRELLQLQGHVSPIRAAAWSGDGKLVLTGAGNFGASGSDTELRLWDAETGKELRRFKGHPTMVWSVAFAPDGARALSGGVDGSVRLWEVKTGKELRRFRGHLTTGASLTGGHRADVRAVLFTPDGRRAISGAHDKTIRVWRLPD